MALSISSTASWATTSGRSSLAAYSRHSATSWVRLCTADSELCACAIPSADCGLFMHVYEYILVYSASLSLDRMLRSEPKAGGSCAQLNRAALIAKVATSSCSAHKTVPQTKFCRMFTLQSSRCTAVAHLGTAAYCVPGTSTIRRTAATMYGCHAAFAGMTFVQAPAMSAATQTEPAPHYCGLESQQARPTS